jgi:calcium-dependent protein kinase
MKIFKSLRELLTGTCNLMIKNRKPENLMMSDRSKKAEVKVIDFGLSKCFKSRNYADSISLKTIVGTPLYIAPEILKGYNIHQTILFK